MSCASRLAWGRGVPGSGLRDRRGRRRGCAIAVEDAVGGECGAAGAGSDDTNEVEGVGSTDGDERSGLFPAAEVAQGAHGIGRGVLLAGNVRDEVSTADPAAGLRRDLLPGEQETHEVGARHRFDLSAQALEGVAPDAAPGTTSNQSAGAREPAGCGGCGALSTWIRRHRSSRS